MRVGNLERSVPATIAILGGAGAEGTGLARRFAAAGHPVILGSRQADRAQAAAASVNEATGTTLTEGADNADAAHRGEIVILSIPFAGVGETLSSLAGALTGKIVVSAIVPMEFAGGAPRLTAVPEGSAAQHIQALLPEARVIAAFHHVGAAQLADLHAPVDSDVLVCGDNAEAKAAVLALAEEIAGVRGVDAGRLDAAHIVEGITTVLVRINRRYKAHAALRITYLPDQAKS